MSVPERSLRSFGECRRSLQDLAPAMELIHIRPKLSRFWPKLGQHLSQSGRLRVPNAARFGGISAELGRIRRGLARHRAVLCKFDRQPNSVGNRPTLGRFDRLSAEINRVRPSSERNRPNLGRNSQTLVLRPYPARFSPNAPMSGSSAPSFGRVGPKQVEQNTPVGGGPAFAQVALDLVEMAQAKARVPRLWSDVGRRQGKRGAGRPNLGRAAPQDKPGRPGPERLYDRTDTEDRRSRSLCLAAPKLGVVVDLGGAGGLRRARLGGGGDLRIWYLVCFGGSSPQDADYGGRPRLAQWAARSLLLPWSAARRWALRNRILRHSVVLFGAGLGCEAELERPGPIRRIGPGPPNAASQPEPVPDNDKEASSKSEP